MRKYWVATQVGQLDVNGEEVGPVERAQPRTDEVRFVQQNASGVTDREALGPSVCVVPKNAFSLDPTGRRGIPVTPRLGRQI